MCEHLEVLLGEASSKVDAAIADLEVMSEAERHMAIFDWNDTAREYQLQECLHQLFERQADLTPEATAAVFEGRRLTYRQLDQMANSLAHLLTQRDIGPGCFVPMLIDRGFEVLVSMLAIMKAGAAFVPLDIYWPPTRLREVIDEIGCRVMLVDDKGQRQQGLSEVVSGNSILVEASTTPHMQQRVSADISSQSPIYVIYTSGSTGKAKGVVIGHRGITNRLEWMKEYFGEEAAQSVLQTTRHVYDSAVWQLFWPLMNGGKTVIPSAGRELSAEYLTGLIERERVTITDFVPSVFNTLVPEVVGSNEMKGRMKTLRSVIIGGEEISVATTYRYKQEYPGTKVVNLYGPTEASIGCISHVVTGEEGAVIPIGRPISNVQIVIVDEQKRVVPPEVVGEIYIAGVCVGQGYFKDEEKTRAAFLDNWIPEIGYDKLYKTGDLARWNNNGEIEYVGRIDEQVKIRGHRIELGEIRSVLSDHPGVAECVVIAGGEPDEKRLAAYFVSKKTGARISPNSLRIFLRDRLPEYMVPASFVELEALPLTAGGKVDRQVLPAPEPPRDESEFMPPQTRAERMIEEVWREVLRLDRVSIHSNFFDLGGHSLLMLQAQGKLQKVFNREISMVDLFKYPTINLLAEFIDGENREEAAAQPPESYVRNLLEGRQRLARRLRQRDQVS
jgi:amino acid adenylation domain-containing protein